MIKREYKDQMVLISDAAAAEYKAVMSEKSKRTGNVKELLTTSLSMLAVHIENGTATIETGTGFRCGRTCYKVNMVRLIVPDVYEKYSDIREEVYEVIPYICLSTESSNPFDDL